MKMFETFGFESPADRRRFATSTLCLFLVLASLTIVDGVSYMCLFSSYLRPGSDYNVSVTILEASSPVLIEVAITGSNEIYTNSASVRAKGSTVVITISVPVSLNENAYTVKIRGTGGLTFYNFANLNLYRKTTSIFIQTDKVLYRPGQTVLFAVVAVNPTMKPYTGVMDIIIYDKEHRRMGRWANYKSPKGYFSGEMQLSSATPLGVWSIEVSIPSGMSPTKKTFEVMDYELPKFEVTIGSSFNYTLLVKNPTAQPPLGIPITAKFTYGEPVRGVVEISASVITDNRKTLEIMEPKWTKTMNLEEGMAAAEIKPDELSSIVPGIAKTTSAAYPWTQLDGYSIYIVAKVTETATKDEVSSSMVVTCRVLKYDLRFPSIASGGFQVGQNYEGYLELKQKDGSDPIESDIRLPNKTFRQITMTFQAGSGCPRKNITRNFPLTASGFVSFIFPAWEFNCDAIVLKASFQDELSNNSYSASMNIEKFKSFTQKYIRVDLDRVRSAQKADEELSFTIRTAQQLQLDAYYYVLMSKGSIVSAQTVANPTSSTLLKIMLDRELAQKLTPKAQLVVWCVANNSEIVSDSIAFYVDGAFANEVTVAFGKTTIEPGKPLTVQVRGEPGSIAYVLAVDKSILLLKGNNIINQKMVLDDLMTYEVTDKGLISQSINSEGIFSRSLLRYLTDGIVYSAGITQPFVPDSSSSVIGGWFDSIESFTRICFPETWIWSSTIIGDDGFGYLTVIAPDTITSFIASAFAIHEQKGLGIAGITSEVKVFLPLFVSTSFPRRVRFGEQFSLRASVYNYLDSPQTITVTLKASLFFNVQHRNGIVKNADVSRQIIVPRKDALSVSFWIITSKAGEIPIVVTAATGLIRDLENKTILVIPEGVEQYYCKSLFIELTKSVLDYSYSFKIEVPSQGQLVPDSVRVELTVIGDLLGTSLNGVDRLIKKPSVCGEQTMMRIGPMVYMAEYLSATNALTAEFEAKYNKTLIQGYQWELTYQRKDKSFSVWGDRDQSGSVWLSAYVVKTFNVAVSSNRLPTDKQTLAATLEWIINTQNPKGFFSEPDKGGVFYKEMQGGTGNGIPMTAYIVVTLIESRDNPYVNSNLLEQSISKAVAYLEGQLNSINDNYTLCIVTYALVLAKSNRADDALKKRDARAQVSLDQKYWGQSKPVSQNNPGDFNPPYVQAPALDVEMTAYALLTYVAQKQITEALPVVKWLLTQRNPMGGFVSTQDTVAALEALTRYAIVASGPRNSGVKVIARAGSEEYSFYPITGSNVFILQKWEPRATSQTVDVYASGSGIVIVQLNVKYNVYTVPVPKNGGIKVDIETETNGDIITIRTCASTTTSNGITGMALQTIDPLSGYVSIDLNEGEKNKNVKKIEVDNFQVAIYYEKLDKDKTCISMKLRKEFVVMLAKNSSISCWDYYNPGNFITMLYGLKEPPQTWQALCPPCNV